MSLLVAEGIEVRRPGAGASAGGASSPLGPGHGPSDRGTPSAEPSTLVLDGLDLRLDAGQLRAVVGPSGSGKTTLLRALCGLLPLEAGVLTLEGRPIEQWEPPAWRRRVGLVPQRPVMLPGTVEDNLALPATLRSAVHGRAVARPPDVLLDALGLDPALAGRPAAELSEGQMARVGLARAVRAGPSVLLLDEPTAALDPVAADRVEALLRALTADDGLAVLWVLHEPARAETLPGPAVVIGRDEVRT